MAQCVVFDNNAYKRLSRARLARIIEAEKARGITALASMAVLQELLARTRDSDSDQRIMNRAAVRKMSEHCRATRGGKIVINFISHTDCQVHRLLTGHEHPNDADLFDRAGELVRVVSQTNADDPLVEIAEDLKAIEQHVARVQAGYVADLEKIAKEKSAGEPNPIKRNLEYAAGIVRRTEAQYGVRFDDEQVTTVLVEVMKFTSIAFTVRGDVQSAVKRKGGGHGQHHNTVWDEEIVAATSIYTTINGNSVLVVTEEDLLIEAAAKAGAGDRIIRIAAYESHLGLAEAER
jgi:hypothetical protein